jgi:uncharacterized protein YceH (UPF0502 family)
MDWQLEASEVRVLGSLLEKEIATPEYYPLSLNALVNACNQKSNREPVVAYDEPIVEDALTNLRAKGLATRITGRDSRVPKHAQRFTESLNLGRREAALICVLMLPRQPGSREARYAHLLAGDIEVSEEAPSAAPRAHAPNGSNAEERIAALERDMAELKREFDEFRRRFE